MIELQTVTTKAKNPSTNEFQDVTWGGINVLSTSGTTNYNNLTNKPTINGVTVQGSLTTGDLLITAADVGALPSGTKYGADFALSIDSQTFVVTAQLKDQDGNNLGQAKTIDLPLETMVVSGSYDDTTQKIILTLKNGQTVEFSVADLVSGLQSEITLNNKLDADLIDDSESINKFVTAAEKAAWNKSVSYMSIPNNGDLNDYYGAENAGNYLCTDANVSTLSHKPSAITTAFRMDVIFYNNQTIQVIYPNDEKCVSFLRIYKNNTWSEWKESAIEMTILSYGNSTWDEFMKAYLLNSIVYCRAGSSTPQTSPQLRLAFMAYVNDEANPTEVEFQYYRSVSNKSDSAQGDEVYVYKLNKTNGWSNLKRNAYSKVAVAAPITKSYASNTVTIGHANSGVTAGTYDSVTVDAQGHVTAGSNYTIDSTPTLNSQNLVTSGGVYEDQQRQDLVLTEVVDVGAKNIQPVELEIIKQSTTAGSWSGNVYTESGSTYTINDDGTITVDTTGLTAQSNLFLSPYLDINNGKWVVSGCPQGGTSETYYIATNSTSWGNPQEYGNGVELNISNNKIRLAISVKARSGILVFRPMICTKAAWDVSHQFEPYALPNPTLTPAAIKAVDEGAKNIADFTSATKTTYTTATFHGVTITRNGDIFTISGTSDTNDNAFFNIYYEGSTTTKIIPPGNWVALIEDYTGSVVKDIAVQIAAPAVPPAKPYGTPIKFSLSGSESGNWLRVNVRPSTTYNGSFRLMICSQEDYAISTAFVPYGLSNPVLTPALIKQVDEGAKNLSSVSSGIISNSGGGFPIPTTPITIPIGTYIVSFKFSGNATRGSVQFRSGSTKIDFLAFDMVPLVTVQIEITTDTIDNFNLYSNGIATISEFMICTLADWNVSQKFVPYAPTNRKLYEGKTNEESISIKSNLDATFIDKDNSDITIFKYGELCIAKVTLKTITSALTGADILTSTAIPSEYRPKYSVYNTVSSRDVGGWASSTMLCSVMSVESDGNIILRTGTNAASSLYVVGTLIWHL